jgi:hypothetical protein
MNVIFVSSPGGVRAAPHDEQKFAPGGFRCPH